MNQYPHEFSGGMRQRAMIAMAIANQPRILIADEPTTALDVTIQAQIVQVLRAAQEETHAATILITHDLGLIAELADRVVVMYAGRVVELAGVYEIFNNPEAPVYGRAHEQPRASRCGSRVARIRSRVSLRACSRRLPAARSIPGASTRKGGRCAGPTSPQLRPFGEGGKHTSACHFAEELAAQQVVGALVEEPS